MTEKKKLKRKVRARMDKTGESYSTAHRNITAEKSEKDPPTQRRKSYKPSDSPELQALEIEWKDSLGLDSLAPAIGSWNKKSQRTVIGGTPNSIEVHHDSLVPFLNLLHSAENTLCADDAKARTVGFVNWDSGECHSVSLSALRSTPREQVEEETPFEYAEVMEALKGARTRYDFFTKGITRAPEGHDETLTESVEQLTDILWGDLHLDPPGEAEDLSKLFPDLTSMDEEGFIIRKGARSKAKIDAEGNVISLQITGSPELMYQTLRERLLTALEQRWKSYNTNYSFRVGNNYSLVATLTEPPAQGEIESAEIVLGGALRKEFLDGTLELCKLHKLYFISEGTQVLSEMLANEIVVRSGVFKEKTPDPDGSEVTELQSLWETMRDNYRDRELETVAVVRGVPQEKEED